MGQLSRFFGRLVKKSAGVSTPAALEVFGVLPTTSGPSVTGFSAMRVPAVACAVSLIAETVGNLPVKLYERNTRQALKDHPAYRLIHDEAMARYMAELGLTPSSRTRLSVDVSQGRKPCEYDPASEYFD